MTIEDEYIAKLLKFFKGDMEKVALWLGSKNVVFGGIIPLELFLLGRGHKVYEYIDAALDDKIWS